ncbi:UNVERIFIED_CONTAM: Subtilisin-like protease SBT3 [Sesamum radiatum]|uniref:Subtilisin-like protease SBT3 n=1 Tax=Sesamum radiatum TaxID=300843 RepID=A0AAW2K8W6_SESRA
MSSIAVGSHVEGASFFGYASRTVRGMAPSARVVMYKALGDEEAYLSDVLAASDQAILDGVDVLSLSIDIDGLEMYVDPIPRRSIG